MTYEMTKERIKEQPVQLIQRSIEWNKKKGIKPHEEIISEATKLISDLCEALAAKLPEEIPEEPVLKKK